MVDRIEIKSEPTGALAPGQEENLPVSGENVATEQESQRPEWLPEKFNSPEELAKAYGELEKQFTQKNQTKTEASETQSQVEQVVENAGLNLTDLTAEFEQTGQLSEDSYEKLAKIGVNRDYVDAYIRGQEALITQYQGEVFNVVGGKEGYTSMIQWASQNLSAEEIEAFNATVNSGNVEQAKMAVKGLHARFSTSEGNEPSLLTGSAGDSGGVFRSTSELVEAMSNPKYKSDPAYRADIEKKLARSSIF
jgi:hypothetical protein